MQYCIIYGHSDTNPGPFVLAVSTDQEYINGFREEHYHLCKGGEIVDDNRYDDFKDYEIRMEYGHYMTPIMITKFCEFCLGKYNQLMAISDMCERDLQYFRFNPNDQAIVDEAFTFLLEIVSDSAPIEYESEIDEIVNGCSVFDIPECLDVFLGTFQPDDKPF